MSSPDRAVFRLPWSALAIPLLVFLITTPLATALPILNLLFLLPVAALFYVMWTRTVVDGQYLTVYSFRGRRRLPWAELDGLEFRGPRWATAVTMSGQRFRLPMIRPRDLPRLAAVSGGRLLLGEDSPAMQAAVEGELPEDSQVGHDQAVDLVKTENAADQVEVAFTDQAQVTISGQTAAARSSDSDGE